MQGSPKYGPWATSGPLRPLIWPAELSLKKQTKLGKLKILTPLYSDMHIAKIHVAVCKALCLICNDTIAVLKEYNIRRHFYESKHSSHYSQFTGQLRQRNFFFGVLARGALESQQCGPPLENFGDLCPSQLQWVGRSEWRGTGRHMQRIRK